jgi:hypothetical protein
LTIPNREMRLAYTRATLSISREDLIEGLLASAGVSSLLLTRRQDPMAGQNGNGNGGVAVALDASGRGEIAFRGLGGRRPRVLAHGGIGEKNLTHDDRYVYWTDCPDGTVTRLPKDGGVPLLLATGQHRPGAIAIAGGWLYWITRRLDYTTRRHAGGVVRMPAGGGDIEILAGEQPSPCSIAVFDDTVAWTDVNDGLATGTVTMKKLGGGPAVTIASKQKQPKSIAIDAQQIYWTSFGNKRPGYFTDGSVARMPRDGEKKRFVIAKNQSMPHSIVVDDEWIYWTTATTTFSPYVPGAILKRRKGEKKTIPLVSWARDGGILALDATHVYWLEEYGAALFRVRKDGGEPTQLMTCNGDSRLHVQSLAVDERCVYWAASDSREAGGAIFKMGK